MSASLFTDGHSSGSPHDRAGAHAYRVFAIVFALMVVNFVDRQIVVSMFPHLAREWALSDVELGALASIVSITVAIGTVPLSLLADRWSRVKSMFLMALVWSAATIACAGAGTYGALLAARGVVGLGEAAYGSVGAALLAGVFPARTRSTVLGAFLAAGLVGSVIGVAIGGVIAERWGWKAAFGIAGLPGLVLAVCFLVVARDDDTAAFPASDGGDGSRRLGARATLAALLAPRSALATCLAAGLQLVVVSTLYAWLPTWFHRYYDLPPDQAGLRTGFVVLVGGVGTVLWGAIADRLGERVPAARLQVPAAAAALSAVFFLAAFALLRPGDAQLALIIAGATVMTGTVGPAAAAVVDVVAPALRATAASVLALTQNLFGLAAGPLITGFLSDSRGLPYAMAFVPVFSVLAAVVFTLAARSYVTDRSNAASGPLAFAGLSRRTQG